MNINYCRILRYSFNLACFSATLGMICFWFYNFLKDEDLSQVNFKPFEHVFNEGEHPMISLCFLDPVIESKLKEYDQSLTKKIYLGSLMGIIPYNDTNKIDFEAVSINLSDFYRGDAIDFSNGTFVERSNPEFLSRLPWVTWIGFYKEFLAKCFGLGLNQKNVSSATYRFNSSIFVNAIRKEKLWIIPHLPRKILKSVNNPQVVRITEIKEIEYALVVWLDQIEILRRRNKRSDPCISDNLNYDETAIAKFAEKIGCEAPYRRSIRNLTSCETSKQMKEASNALKELWNNFQNPCTNAEVMTLIYKEQILTRNGSNWFHVTVDFPKKVKEIVTVKAVDIQSLIGNAGGYIGLFLGNGIIHRHRLPQYYNDVKYSSENISCQIEKYFYRICNTAAAGHSTQLS